MENKRVVYVEPWKVKLLTEPLDDQNLEPNHVIVKNKFSLISPGTELACLSGTCDGFVLPKGGGYTAVGQITAIGQNVTEFAVGDLVYHCGRHRAYEKIDISTQLIVAVPNDLEIKHAAFTKMATIAITALWVSNIQLDDYVGVIGQGVIGNFAAQLAQLQGANVIAMDLDANRLQKSRQCGIENSWLTDDDIKDKIADFTKASGISTIIEATGQASVADKAISMIADRGQLILLGSPRAAHQTNLTDFLNQIHLAPRLIEVKGAHEYRFPVKPNAYLKHSRQRNAKIIMDLMMEKKLAVDPLLTHVLKPQDAQQGYDGLKNKKSEFIGVLFDWT